MYVKWFTRREFIIFLIYAGYVSMIARYLKFMNIILIGLFIGINNTNSFYFIQKNINLIIKIIVNATRFEFIWSSSGLQYKKGEK